MSGARPRRGGPGRAAGAALALAAGLSACGGEAPARGDTPARDGGPADAGQAAGTAHDASAPAWARATPEPERALFVDATERSGVTFVHAHGGIGNRELPETMGGGLGLLDYDGDGDLDLYLAQSGALREAEEATAGGGPNELWANDGAARFTAVAGAAGAAGHGYSMGCAVGDVDGNGHDDVLDLCWGANALFRNAGGAFTADPSELWSADLWSVSAAFFDADGDGDLDLYVVNYLDSPPGSYREKRFNPSAPGPYKAYPHPDRFLAQADRFLRNDGRGVFSDESAAAGFAVPPGKGLGVVPTDVDLDGRVDLYVANDSTPNFLFVNRGDGSFAEMGSRSGTAFNDHGRTEAGMGVDVADVDEDGDLDLFVTNLDLETNTLYLNHAAKGAEYPDHRDRTNASGLGEPSRLSVGFGALFLDADRDADLDLLVANGHIIDNVEAIADNRLYAQPNQLFLNDGAGHYCVAPPTVAPGLERRTVSRGSAFGDLDGDGDLDVVIGANDEPPQVFLADPPDRPHVAVRLAGPPGNPHGLGAKLFLELAGGRILVRGIEATRSYASASEPVVATGLPSALVAIEVLWPDGERERFTPAAGAAELTLRYGEGE